MFVNNSSSRRQRSSERPWGRRSNPVNSLGRAAGARKFNDRAYTKHLPRAISRTAANWTVLKRRASSSPCSSTFLAFEMLVESASSYLFLNFQSWRIDLGSSVTIPRLSVPARHQFTVPKLFDYDHISPYYSS